MDVHMARSDDSYWKISRSLRVSVFFFFQAEDGIRDLTVTGVQTCALPISAIAPVKPATAFRRFPAAYGQLGQPIHDFSGILGVQQRQHRVPDKLFGRKTEEAGDAWACKLNFSARVQ